jgi:uncharacterized protein (TIGR03437 family)
MKMRRALGVIPFCLAIGGLPALPDTLPASCGGVGAKSYTPPAVTIPAVTLNLGTVITVTNASVAMNGDTSSVAALNANPGPDGISIAEAIMATNNDPGTWNIQFAPALKGSIIVVDSGFAKGLPFLTGGNVTINGDIDGDGQPDITLTSISGTDTGFFVLSGGNTLYGLALQGCGICVTIQRPSAKYQLPPATGTTFSGITVSNLVMTNIQHTGIEFNPDDTPPTVATKNTWDHILITGNTITGNASGPILGIDFGLGDAGDTLQHTTIANNKIVLAMPGALGIAMNLGSGPSSTGNQTLDTLIANNVISGSSLSDAGIRLATGVGAGSSNLIDGAQMIANQISLAGGLQYPPGLSIDVVSGDAATDDGNPSLRPIQYSENNIARNIGILSNTLEGGVGLTILIQAACCGNGNNTIGNLSILGNSLTGSVQLTGAASGGFFSRPATGNTLSNVVIQSNTIGSLQPTGNPNFNLDEAISGAGIEAWAGWEEAGNSINGISIANNDVNTPFVGIDIIGGFGTPQGPADPYSPANNNVVSAAQIFCNQVDQAPTLGVTPSSGVKGITVAAGAGELPASGNHVEVSVYDNLVAGVLGDASLFANLGSGASGNTISITQISGPANGPQFTAAGLVNAATIQQHPLAPGSLVSLFGSNLAGSATGGTTVQFGSISAPIIFASSSQLNLQVPWELKGQSTSMVTVTANSVTSAPQSVPVGLADPGIFSLGVPQGGQGAITNAAGAVVDANSPAHAGDYLQIFATGLGTVTNTPQTGAAAAGSPLSYVINYPTATIGGVKAPVSFAGLSPGFIGLYQVNVRVPQGTATGDAIPVLLSIGSLTSNAVVISVR